MTTVEIFRTSDKKAPKLTKAQMEKVRQDLNLKFSKRRIRVMRPNLVEFLLGGEFNKLPVVPQRLIYNNYERDIENKGKSWIVPNTDLGRTGIADRSTAIAIKAWVAKNLSEYGFDPETISIVPVEGEA